MVKNWKENNKALNGRTVNALGLNCRDFSNLHEKLSCTITLGSMSLLNCEIYQRRRVSAFAGIELILLIAHLIVRGARTEAPWIKTPKTKPPTDENPKEKKP